MLTTCDGVLWALSPRGVAHSLTADPQPTAESTSWQPHPVTDTSIRRLSACGHSCWALGANGRPYLWLTDSTVPIRVEEETYENQRWYPIVGFVGSTLPTERAGWSDVDGLTYRPREAISLPCDGWTWADPWTCDANMHYADKQVTRPSSLLISDAHFSIKKDWGWQYAFSFYATLYNNVKTKRDYVRRRRWFRIRQYTAFGRWVQLQRPHGNHLIDLDVGGVCLDQYSVWALSRDGRLWFRDGIGSLCPHGLSWMEIPVVIDEEHQELSQVSCSSDTGQLCVATWDGQLLVRVGIVACRKTGVSWSRITSPNASPAMNVTLGSWIMWLNTVDGKLWTHVIPTSGVSDLAGVATRDSWISHDSSRVCRVQVGINQQVFCIDQTTHQICIRSHVTSDEPTGRQWIQLLAHVDTQVVAQVDRTASEVDNVICKPSAPPEHLDSDHPMAIAARKAAESVVNDEQLDSDTEVEDDQPAVVSADDGWLQVSAGACNITSDSIPRHWLTDSSSLPNTQLPNFVQHSLDKRSEWRNRILFGLNDQKACVSLAFPDFKPATEDSGNIGPHSMTPVNESDLQKSTTAISCHVKRPADTKWLSARLVMDEHKIEVEITDSSLSRRARREGQNKMCVHISDICAALPRYSVAKGKYVLLLSTPGMTSLQSWLRVSCSSHSDREAVMRPIRLSISAQLHYNGEGRLLFGVTTDHGLYVANVGQMQNGDCTTLRYHQVPGHLQQLSVCSQRGVVVGMGVDEQLWICESALDLLACASSKAQHCDGLQTDVIRDVVLENQRYSSFRGFITFPGALRGGYVAWSDDSGVKPLTREQVKLPAPGWRWLDEWSIDYQMDSDADGWVYATSFADAMSSKDSCKNASVRRRYWTRRRQVDIVGPWNRIHCKLSVKQIDLSPCVESTSPWLWLVTTEGHVFFSQMDSSLIGQPWHWQILESNTRISHISAMTCRKLWALDLNGLAYSRYSDTSASMSAMLQTDWREVPTQSSALRSTRMSVIVANHVHCVCVTSEAELYRRVNCSNANPIGTDWQYVYSNVKQVAFGSSSSDDIWAVMQSDKSVKDGDQYDGCLAVSNLSTSHSKPWQLGLTAPWKQLQLL